MTVTLRYAILHHTGHPTEPDHFDLLFELEPGATLATWRIDSWPPNQHTPLRRLPDHRREYLHYEGPISQNRGQVKRVARGALAVVTNTPDSIELILDQRQRLTLTKSTTPDIWSATLQTLNPKP